MPKNKAQLHLSAIDPELLKKAREICSSRGTTIAKTFRGFLRQLTKCEPDYQVFKTSTGKINHELSGYENPLPIEIEPEEPYDGTQPEPYDGTPEDNVTQINQLDRRRSRGTISEPDPDTAA
jgi:hypothetical protein